MKESLRPAAFLATLIPVCCAGQGVILNLHDGSSIPYPIESVKSIQLEPSQMQANLWSDETVPNVRSLQPSDLSTSVSGSGPTAPVALRIAPNPSNGEVTITLHMDAMEHVNITLFDGTGSLVRMLYNGPLSPGTNNLRWNAQDDEGRTLSPGIYLCRVSTSSSDQAVQIVLQ